jgi:Cytochrome c554 and c-prime
VLWLFVGGLACQRAEEKVPSPPSGAAPVERPAFVGGAACATCHPTQAQAFKGSHHARAMQTASDTTVLGDFNGARFVHGGMTSTFFKRDGKYLVRTEGADGAVQAQRSELAQLVRPPPIPSGKDRPQAAPTR